MKQARKGGASCQTPRYGLLRTPLAEPGGGRDGGWVGCPAGTWMGTGCRSSSPVGRTASWRPAGARRSRHWLTPQLSASLVCVQCAPPVCIHCNPSPQHLAKAVRQRIDCRSFQSRGRWVPPVSQKENNRHTPPPPLLSVRSDKTGEVVFRDTFNSPVAAILVADYRMDGRQEVLCCAHSDQAPPPHSRVLALGPGGGGWYFSNHRL